MRLVLWDIDGTLVDSGGAGLEAFLDAFERIAGQRPRERPQTAGRTDHAIALDLMALNGVDDPEGLWPEFCAVLADALAAREGEMRAQGRALPGAREAIDALGEADGVVQSVLTGNIAPNAEAKLGAFGLDSGLDFEVGAYGSDDRHRPALVPIARTRAGAKYGVEPALEDTILIGDTPRDVDAALTAGARVVGVATGLFTVEDLEQAGAEIALPDLNDPEAVVAAVLAPSEALS